MTQAPQGMLGKCLANKLGLFVNKSAVHKPKHCRWGSGDDAPNAEDTFGNCFPWFRATTSRRGPHSRSVHSLVTFIHSPSMNLTIAGISVVRQRIVLLRISQKLPSTQSTTPLERTRLRESSPLANPSLSRNLLVMICLFLLYGFLSRLSARYCLWRRCLQKS